MKKSNVVLPILFVILTFNMSHKAHAYGSYRSSSYSDGSSGWMLQANGIYYFTTEGGNPGNPSTTITRQLIDALVGYHFNLFFIGANYDYDAIVNSGGSNPGWTDSYRSYGGDLGLMTDNVYLLFTYYFNSIGTFKGGIPASATDFNNGSGYQIMLGYNFDVGSGFGIGPSLVYKSLTYNNFASGPSTSYTFTTLVPQANIRYSF